MVGNGILGATEEGSGIAETAARANYCETFIAGDDPANERWSDKGYVHLVITINSREMGSWRISCRGRLKCLCFDIERVEDRRSDSF